MRRCDPSGAGAFEFGDRNLNVLENIEKVEKKQEDNKRQYWHECLFININSLYCNEFSVILLDKFTKIDRQGIGF